MGNQRPRRLGRDTRSDFPEVGHLPQLTAAIRPLPVPGQLIHGDLSGNVLFHEHLPPAIIDFTPYWRPAAYATAIVVADALIWEDADSQILGAARDIEDFGQYLVRALVFRKLTDWICNHDQPAQAEGSNARWAWRPILRASSPPSTEDGATPGGGAPS